MSSPMVVYSDVSRPFAGLETGRIAVKVMKMSVSGYVG